MGVISEIWDGVKTPIIKRVADAITKMTIKMKDPTITAIFGGDKKENLVNAYRQLPVIYSAINAKARNLANIPLVITKIGSDKPIEPGDSMIDLIDNPNPKMSKAMFITALVTQLDLGGNYYVWPDDEEMDGLPLNLWVFPYGSVKERYSGGKWAGWTITRGQKHIPFDPDELIHNMYYNPDSDVRGLAPMEAIGQISRIKFNALLYNEKFFENDCTPTLAITSEKPMSQRQIQQNQHELIDNRKGVKKAHKALLLTGGLKAEVLGATGKDLQMIETLKLTTEEILMVFKVPKTEVSIYEGINYATALSQDMSFWQKTLIPLGTMITDNLNQQFMRKYGYHCYFDFLKVDALNMKFLESVKAGKELYLMGFTRNELNRRLNWGFEEAPWGDEPYVQAIPAGIIAAGANKETAHEKKIEPGWADREEIAKGLRAARWKKIDNRVSPIMIRAASAIRKYFAVTKKKVLSKITKCLTVYSLKYANDETSVKYILKDDQRLRNTIEDAIKEVSDEKLKTYIESHIESAVKAGLASIEAELQHEVAPDAVTMMIKNRLQKGVKQVNGTLRDMLRVRLADTIQEGMTEQQAADAVKEAVNKIFDIERHRAKTIARTETHGAYSDSRFEAMGQTNPIGKMWITSRDASVRDTHMIDGERVGFDDTFSNGLSRPHDPAGDPGNVINCRCVMVPIYDPAEMEV